jgi:tetratricopeptide (TPR) repeat protein
MGAAMNSVRSVVLVTILAFLSAPAGVAQEKTVEQLGKVTFPTSCDPKVQAQFERGVAMLHSYWFTEAGKVFDAVAKQDPNCVMAYWGYAVNLLGNSLVGPPPAKDAQAAWEALERARAVGGKTQRERDWIEALSAYYRDYDKVSLDDRLLAYTKAMEQMTQRYPDDFEAWAYYALTLQASAPKTDKAYANQLKSAAILEKLFKQNPQHPGVSHYLIHAYDYPPLADKGIDAARRYAGIAPAAPHARHMPSHIYSMVGLWEESIASNRSALQVQSDYYHATDFMVYAHLQLAQDARAKALIDEIYKVGRNDLLNKDNLSSLGAYTALAVIPARYVLERADWKGAATLPVVPTKRLVADSLIRFTRGLGMARSGDIAGAKSEIEAIQGIQKALLKAKDAYWAARSQEQILAVSAWVAHAEGSREQALQLMRSAADGEDGSVKHVSMENRLYPMRELIAELLLESGQAGPALREFEAALKENPNRYRGLYGAARATEAAGDRQKAEAYFSKFVAVSAKADTDRPEIAQAKTFLAKK